MDVDGEAIFYESVGDCGREGVSAVAGEVGGGRRDGDEESYFAPGHCAKFTDLYCPGKLVGVKTAPRYRFFSVRDEFPGLWRVDEGGVSIEGELYEIPLEVIRDQFVPAEPPELELGVAELDDGGSSLVVLMRKDVVESGEGLTDISEYGGWRAYRAAARTG